MSDPTNPPAIAESKPGQEKRYDRLLATFAELQTAAQAVVDETDRIFDGEPWPQKYRAPYGAITALRSTLASTYGLRSPPASADPTQQIVAWLRAFYSPAAHVFADMIERAEPFKGRLSVPSQETPRAQPVAWQDIATAPTGKVLLFFAVTDIDADGAVKNWKIATGHIRYGAAMEPDKEGRLPIIWDGRELRTYDIVPTMWMPVPAPPAVKPGEESA